jgi:hypothetical protein
MFYHPFKKILPQETIKLYHKNIEAEIKRRHPGTICQRGLNIRASAIRVQGREEQPETDRRLSLAAGMGTPRRRLNGSTRENSGRIVRRAG